MESYANYFDESFLKHIKTQQKMFEPIGKQFELINKALEASSQITSATLRNIKPYIDYIDSTTSTIRRLASSSQKQNFKIHSDLDKNQIQSNVLSLEDRLSELKNQETMTTEDKLLLEKALVFICDQSSKNFSESIDSFDITTYPNAKIMDPNEYNEKSKLCETNNSKHKEKIVKKTRNSNQSFPAKIFSKETIQAEVISFIHQTVYTWVLLTVSGKLDIAFLAISLIILLKILIRDKNDS